MNTFMKLWVAGEGHFEKRLRSAMNTASPGSTVYVALTKKGAITAIVITKLHHKPDTPNRVYVSASAWFDMRAGMDRKVA
jgi:hypothetical protein